MSSLDKAAAELSRTSFFELFKQEPYDFQQDCLQHLFKMLHPSVPCAPVFLCAPTGGGKSAVRDAFASGRPGITISIAPLLGLNADQSEKLKLRKQTTGTVSIHYDQYRHCTDIDALENTILNVASEVSVVLFCSPQMLTDRESSQSFIDKIVHLGLLRQVCIDEAHLFAEFGLYFRAEFVKLSEVLFNKLLVDPSGCETICPVLVMTASATQELLNQLNSMTGLAFLKENVFWPDACGMQCRLQSINFQPHSKPIQVFKKKLNDIAKSGQHFIYYSNRRLAVQSATECICSQLDADDVDGDVVLIVGTLGREQKFHRTQLFLNPSSLPLGLDDFKPIGCTTTRSLGAAGWDSDLIHLVFSADMPTNLLALLQEKGRAGRRFGADGTEDFYWVCFDLDDYLYLVLRAYRGQASADVKVSDFAKLGITRSAYTKIQLADCLEVLQFFLLPNECQHCILERRLSNPYLDASSASLSPCVSFCQYCVDGGEPHASFERFVRADVELALFNLLCSVNRLHTPTVGGDGIFIKALCDYPNAQRLFFDSKSAKKPTAAMMKRVVAMLHAAGILQFKYVVTKVLDSGGKEEEVDTLHAWIPFSSDLVLVFKEDSRWSRLPLKLPKDTTPEGMEARKRMHPTSV